VRAAQQIQFVADCENIAEDGRDLFLHGRHKGGNRAVIRSIPIRERNEEDVFMAGAFDLARTDHAFGVGQQDDFQQDLPKGIGTMLGWMAAAPVTSFL